MAFPNNEYYLRGVQQRIPLMVREKLALHVLFTEEDGSLSILVPTATVVSKLVSFDTLFNGSDSTALS